MSDEPELKTVAGRSSLADVMKSWDTFVQTVESLPVQAKQKGTHAALAFARTHLHAIIYQLSLAWGRTKEDEINQHRIHAALSNGIVRSMLRDGPKGSIEHRIGENARMLFIQAVVNNVVPSTLRAVFERSREGPDDDGYMPDTGE
jgi:hypothetical protein